MSGSPRTSKQLRLCTSAISICFVIIIVSQYIPNQQILFRSAYSSIKIVPDNNGVPIVNYGCYGETYIGRQRNPITVAQAALEHYDTYNRNHDKVYLQKFLNNSNWLVDNAVSYGNYSILEYHFFWPKYNMEPPWRSGMAQGQALEVLINAHNITNDKKYLETAKSLLNAFFVEVKDGGVTYKTPNGGWWYELYASPEAVESRVLNGHTAGLLGIYKYYQYTQDPAAKYLFDQGVSSLKESLPQYEYVRGQYSIYDILDNTVPAPLLYHMAQTNHLGQLYEITGEEIFKTYYDKWTKFELPESIAQARRTYYDASKIELSLVPADQDFIPIEESNLIIRNTENRTANSNMPAKFRIEGDGGNKTTQFTASERFLYIGSNISVTLGDQVKTFTNLNISFAVIREGQRDENNVIFQHGPVGQGWKDDINYFVRIDSNSSKSITVMDLFGHDDEYMVVRGIGVEVPKNACVNSMEFEVDFN